MSEQEYSEFNQAYTKAQNETFEREEKVAAVSETVEKELSLIGSSAIEDKLQDKVADTI